MSQRCHVWTHAPQTKTYSITSIGACEQRLRHGWPTTLHRLLAPGRCLLSLAAANLQLRRQTDQRRRNGWHELADHDRTMQLFKAFACLEGRARIIGIEEDADRIGRELPRGKLISTLSSPAILFANHAAPCRQALGGMLLHPLGELRRAHQAGLYRDVSEVRGGDGLLVAICRRGETAEHGDDLYHDRRTPSLRWALAPLTL
jgi:hypothetical protein